MNIFDLQAKCYLSKGFHSAIVTFYINAVSCGTNTVRYKVDAVHVKKCKVLIFGNENNPHTYNLGVLKIKKSEEGWA